MHFRSDILEPPPRHIPIQNILAPIRNKQVRESIVVIIARTHPLPPARMRQADLFCGLTKRAVAFVVIHPVRGTGPGYQEDVQQSVVIVIDHRDAATRRFHDELLRLIPAVWDRLGEPRY